MDAAQYMVEVPREEQERRGKIRTFTGKLVDPFALEREDIDIRDIAHHLSNLCRYTGAGPFYSVAQHSLLVADYFVKPEERLAGLLHDAAETYINDIASPLKRAPSMKAYVAADEEITALVFHVFGLNGGLLAKVKPFDDLVFQREVMSFWPTGTVYSTQVINPIDPTRAELQFLNEFRRLFPGWKGDDAGTSYRLGEST